MIQDIRYQPNAVALFKGKVSGINRQVYNRTFCCFFPMSHIKDLRAIQILFFSSLAIYAFFLWQGNKGFSLWDEGYLWYGAQRVLQGEVPILDFMAYDPGRYYWSAAWMGLWGNDGIMSLRASVAIFQAAGLFVGLWLIADNTRQYSKSFLIFLLLASITLVIWMLPRHKFFDISISIFLVGILNYLIKNPSKSRYFLTGVTVGLIAVFGRNHGMYGAAASVATILWLNINRSHNVNLLQGALFWSAGVVAGFSPIFFMALLVPGFASAFIDSILYMFELGSTNITLPVPWPWKVQFTGRPVVDWSKDLLVGLFFLGTLLFGVLSVLWIVKQKIQRKPVAPAFVATAFLGLPYAHYAFSRADVGHLSLGIYPVLIGCFVLLNELPTKIKWSSAIILMAASVWMTYAYHPGWVCRVVEPCFDVKVSGDNLKVSAYVRDDIQLLRRLTDEFSPNGRPVLVVPFWPASYPLLERKSPVWEIYPALPRSEAFEREEIERIKKAKPGFVFVWDMALDGVEDRRFRHTHPLTYQFITEHFEPVNIAVNPAYKVYKSKE